MRWAVWLALSGGHAGPARLRAGSRGHDSVMGPYSPVTVSPSRPGHLAKPGSFLGNLTVRMQRPHMVGAAHVSLGLCGAILHPHVAPSSHEGQFAKKLCGSQSSTLPGFLGASGPHVQPLQLITRPCVLGSGRQLAFPHSVLLVGLSQSEMAAAFLKHSR